MAMVVTPTSQTFRVAFVFSIGPGTLNVLSTTICESTTRVITVSEKSSTVTQQLQWRKMTNLARAKTIITQSSKRRWVKLNNTSPIWTSVFPSRKKYKLVKTVPSRTLTLRCRMSYSAAFTELKKTWAQWLRKHVSWRWTCSHIQTLSKSRTRLISDHSTS